MRHLIVSSLRVATSRGHLAAGCVAALVSFMGWLATARVIGSLSSPVEVALGWLVAITAITVISVVPLVGGYALGRDTGVASGPGVIATVRATARTYRDCGRGLVGASILAIGAALAVGFVVALALHAIVLGVGTLAGYAAYALGAGRLVPPTAMVWMSGTLVGLGVTVGILAVRFFDCLVCFTDAGPIGAVRESLRVARARPWTLAVYGLVTAVVFALPGVVVTVLSTVEAFPSILLVAIAIPAVAGSFAVFAAFHAAVFTHRVLPVVSPDAAAGAAPSSTDPLSIRGGPLVTNPVRVMLVVLVLTGLLVGSASIRALDIRPTGDSGQPGPVDPDATPAAIITDASVPTVSTSHHVVQRSEAWNETTESFEHSVTFGFERDVENRRMVLRFETLGDDSLSHVYYLSVALFATKYGGGDTSGGPVEPPDELAWVERTAGNWTVRAVPGYSLIEGEPTISLPDGFRTQNWTVTKTGDSTVVLRATGADVSPLQPQDTPLQSPSSIEVHVDRESGYVSSIEEELHYDPDARNGAPVIRTTTTFRNWGHHTVDRPDPIGSLRPIEWAWAIAYY